MRKIMASLAALFIGACYDPPSTVKPITGFDASRYTGKWFEVARLDNSFEKGLSHTTAEYTLREDGGITVVNRGYHTQKKE